jgi:hypothetical protein
MRCRTAAQRRSDLETTAKCVEPILRVGQPRSTPDVADVETAAALPQHAPCLRSLPLSTPPLEPRARIAETRTIDERVRLSRRTDGDCEQSQDQQDQPDRAR